MSFRVACSLCSTKVQPPSEQNARDAVWEFELLCQFMRAAAGLMRLVKERARAGREGIHFGILKSLIEGLLDVTQLTAAV
jgi:hypothetical protein